MKRSNLWETFDDNSNLDGSSWIAGYPQLEISMFSY